MGSTLLKWRLDALLGVGGTAAVYAATHHNRSRVALKILHRELGAYPELRTRFLREAYVANSVGHDGAVQVLDDQISEDGEPVLVMQLLEGQSLDSLQAARGVLSPEDALRCADQILEVLVAAHARGIVHRDIKPQNVFVTTSGALKVLDFGVARLFDGTASMTATGVLVGTPAYMPPEQAGGRISEIGPPSDLWSVGATVFTLLTGRFVHEAENAQQHTIRAAVFPARSLRTLRPDLPAPVIDWVDRSLAFEIPRRFQTAVEMREALSRARASAGGAPAAAPMVPVAAHGPAAPPAPLPPNVPVARNPPVAPGPTAAAAAPGPVHLYAPPEQGPEAPSDPASIARLHGLPPPAPKRQLTRAEMGGIAGVFVLFVLVVSLVVYKVASRRHGIVDYDPVATTSSSSTGAPALSAFVGSPSDPSGRAAPADTPPSAAGSAESTPQTPAQKRFTEEARAAVEAAENELRQCGKRLGPKGRMSVEVTFHPDGETTAQVEIRFSRTPTGTCVEDAFRSKKLTPFEGPAVTVTRMVTVPN